MCIRDRNTNKLEIFSEEIKKETVRQGGWRKNDWKGKILVVLVFGVPSDMTRIEFKRKCDELCLYDENRVQEEMRRSKTVLL